MHHGPRTLISADSRWWSYYYLPTYLPRYRYLVLMVDYLFAGIASAPWRAAHIINIRHSLIPYMLAAARAVSATASRETRVRVPNHDAR